MMHICSVCFGRGKSNGKACLLCSTSWRTHAAQSASELNRGIPSTATVREDPLMFGGFDRGWDLESRARPELAFLENAFTVDGGGVLLQKAVPPEAFKQQLRSLETVLSRTKPSDRLKYDVLRDRKTGYSHLYRSMFDDKEWRQNTEIPSQANGITHIGVFKDSKSATEFLKRRYGIEV